MLSKYIELENYILFNRLTKKLFPQFVLQLGKFYIRLWLCGLIIVFPITVVVFGWQVALAYLICKLTGACPI